MINLYQKITNEMLQVGSAIRNYSSIRWFTKNIQRLMEARNTKSRLKKMSTPGIGKMFLLSYTPKTIQKLPYFDRFPLVFILNIQSDGFLGINLHYLPPSERAVLMKALLHIQSNNDKMDESTRLKLSYKTMKSFAESRRARVCIKKYLYSNVETIGLIPADEWIHTTFLPLEGFRRKSKNFSKNTVWKESVDKIKERNG
jgi:hypothetical protein